MTRDEIIAMAKEAGCVSATFWPDGFTGLMGVFERFAALVEAAEREACAQVCEAEHVGADVCDDCDNELDETYNRALRDGATAIRARGAA